MSSNSPNAFTAGTSIVALLVAPAYATTVKSSTIVLIAAAHQFASTKDSKSHASSAKEVVFAVTNGSNTIVNFAAIDFANMEGERTHVDRVWARVFENMEKTSTALLRGCAAARA